MKAKVVYSLPKTSEIINLEDYGYDENTEWSNLSDEEQYVILDSLREENVVYVDVENYLDF